MPTLLRLSVVLIALVCVAFAVVFALANLVEIEPREMSVTVSPDRLRSDRR